jgi:hypothetical protein
MFVNNLGQDYYGPPAPNQTYEEYQIQQGQRVAVSIGAGLVAASMINPAIGIVAGISTWLLTPGLAKKSKSKSKTQGG